MIGTQQNQPALFSYQIDLEQRVRADNPLGRVKEVVDFAFVRAARHTRPEGVWILWPGDDYV